MVLGGIGLPSQFLPRTRTDALAEELDARGRSNWRCHDRQSGVNGQETRLKESATQFILTEAKLFSRLATPELTHAPYFDQAARSVACIAELHCTEPIVVRINSSSHGFYVIAPQSQIEAHKFSREISKDSVKSKVRQRIFEYEPVPDDKTKERFGKKEGIV